MLKGRAGHGIGQNTAEEEHKAGHYRAEGLLNHQIFGAALVVGGVEMVKPNGEARCEGRVNRVGHKQNGDQPY